MPGNVYRPEVGLFIISSIFSMVEMELGYFFTRMSFLRGEVSGVLTAFIVRIRPKLHMQV